MVLAFGVALELGTVEVNLAQISRGVAYGFVIEVRRGPMAALAAGGHGPRAHFVAKFDHCDEAVTVCAIPLLRSGILVRAKRRERAPKRRRESDGNAGRGIAEGLDEVARQSLEAVDVAPGRLPRAEVGGMFVRSFGQRLLK